jgi:hypothetical protein
LGRERTQTVRLTADPTGLLKLQVGYDRTDSRRDGTLDSGLWLVTLGEERYLRFEGYANTHDPRDATPYRDALYRLEVRPFVPLAVSGQFRRVLLENESRGVAGAGATLKVLRGVEVAAAYRRPTQPAEGPVPVGRDYRLILAPVGGLRVFGQYSVRPEDERGLLLDETHRTAGLETALGSFTLQGSLTRMEGRLTPEPGTRTDLLAILTLGGRTRLYGGLRTEDPLTGPAERERIYRLGITQSAGAAFLMLEGQFGWAVDATGRRAWSPEEARAQARLGVRF